MSMPDEKKIASKLRRGGQHGLGVSQIMAAGRSRMSCQMGLGWVVGPDAALSSE